MLIHNGISKRRPATLRTSAAAAVRLLMPFFSGMLRMRLPVAAKIALSTAGAATAIVGSPTPPQKSPDGMTIDLDLRHLVDAHARRRCRSCPARCGRP